MLVIYTFLLLLTRGLSESLSRFTNIECEMLDPAYATYQQCELKIKGRGIVALYVYAKLNKGPFNNAKVNLSMWRKYSGYRPFMFNSTFDYCKFMAKNEQKLSFEKIFLDILSTSSNLNHTCPYEHAIIVRDMVLKEEYFKFLPVPAGQYKFQLMAATDNHWKTMITVAFYLRDVSITLK